MLSIIMISSILIAMKWVEANVAFVASSNISCITLAMSQPKVSN